MGPLGLGSSVRVITTITEKMFALTQGFIRLGSVQDYRPLVFGLATMVVTSKRSVS